jgi:sulfite dehydrogenase (quinone) subunit SoeC
MKPALSVIFFTVLSGAGLGLAIWTVIACQFVRAMDDATFVTSMIFSFVLTTAGLISSTLHLANPKNAWRAFSRFKTSWLSREGVLAIVFYPLAGLFILSMWKNAAPPIQMLFGALVIVCALAILYCTGMIYACLKTIPLWHSWRTPVKYVLYGLLSGLLIFVAIVARGDMPMEGWLRVALALLFVALLFWMTTPSEIAEEQHTLNDALGFKEGRVRLLDVGHTHGTFLTNEFGFRIARARAASLATIACVLAFIAPIAIVVIESSLSAQGMLGLAALLCVLGLLVDRWLFFANARHVVMRYHGQ